MINPLSPPTDNLYKFVAISGLVLLFGAPVYWGTFELQVQERRTEAIVAFEKSWPPPEYFFLPTSVGTNDGGGARERLEALRQSVEAAQAENVRATERLREFERLERWLTVLAILLAVVGLAATVGGFRLWYVRVQRPQDQLLWKQAMENRTSAAT